MRCRRQVVTAARPRETAFLQSPMPAAASWALLLLCVSSCRTWAGAEVWASEAGSSDVLQELHRERETSTGRRHGPTTDPERTPGCSCPALFSPVCDPTGKLVAPSACDAACQSIPEDEYSHDWCNAASAPRNHPNEDADGNHHRKHATEDNDKHSQEPRRKTTHSGASESDKWSSLGAVKDVGEGRFEAMLPAPNAMSHGSFLEQTPFGLVAAWFSGGAEGSNGVSIYVSHKGPGLTDPWGPAELVVRKDGYSMQNPVLLFDGDALHLFHTCQEAAPAPSDPQGEAKASSASADAAAEEKKQKSRGGEEHKQKSREGEEHKQKRQLGEEEEEEEAPAPPPHHQTTSRIWHHVAKPNGSGTGFAAFKKVGELPLGSGAFDRNRIVRDPLTGGAWLFPIYFTSTTNKREDASSLVRLKEGSLDFEAEQRPPSWPPGLVQPSVVSLDGHRRLKAFFRDRMKKRVHTSESTDGGLTWSEATPGPVPNNNAAIQAAILSTGEVVAVLNPIRKRRYRLSVAVSFDEGETFPVIRDLECAGCSTDSEGNVVSVFAKGDNHGPEYSYPTLLEGPDGRVHVSYTWSEPGADMGAASGQQNGNRAAIKYAALSREFLGLGSSSSSSSNKNLTPSSPLTAGHHHGKAAAGQR